MTNTQDDKAKLNSQYRTLMILWMAFLWMFAIYYFLPVFIGGPQEPNKQLLIVFNVMSPLLVLVSFFVKRKFLARSVEAHDVNS